MPVLKLGDTEASYCTPDEPLLRPSAGRVCLNLGCNQHPKPDHINVDAEAYPGVDVVADLEQHWPWDDNSIDYIIAEDLVEHLHNSIFTMNEAWRVLKPGGIFHIWVPSTESLGAFQDPTHVSFWNENSFLYYMDESVPGSLRYIYCNAKRNPIVCRYLPRQVVTSVKNQAQVSWVRAILEAKK